MPCFLTEIITGVCQDFWIYSPMMGILYICMTRFSKRKPDTVMVKDRKLICPVCDNDQFIETRAQMNTAVASFFDLDFANKSARCFVCSECTYVFWFRA